MIVKIENTTFFIFTSDQISNKSDSKCYSDWKAIAIRTTNDPRIEFMRSQAPPPLASPPLSSPPLAPPSQAPPSQDAPSIVTNNIMTPIPSESKPNKYPLLSELGIKPDFETTGNKQKIETLLSEMVSLHKANNKDMKFTYAGNGKEGFVVPIPKAKNYATYEKNERRDKWLTKIIEYLKTHSDDKCNDDDVCLWLLKDLNKHHPKKFVRSAINAGLHVVQK